MTRKVIYSNICQIRCNLNHQTKLSRTMFTASTTKYKKPFQFIIKKTKSICGRSQCILFFITSTSLKSDFHLVLLSSARSPASLQPHRKSSRINFVQPAAPKSDNIRLVLAMIQNRFIFRVIEEGLCHDQLSYKERNQAKIV